MYRLYIVFATNMPRKNSKQIEYISLTEAAKYCGCTQQYLSLRARQGKLKAKKFGRNWTTTKKWVEQYLEKTNSSKERVLKKKAKVKAKTKVSAKAFLSLADSYLFVVNQAFRSIGKTIKKSKTIFQLPEFKYAVAGVLAFVILEYGFAYAGPTLSMSKDFFVEGITVFSEETNKGISNFSESIRSFSDTANEIAEVPSVNIPVAPRLSIPNAPPVPRINISFATIIDKNFSSTKAGARGVAQNFSDVKNYTSDKIVSAGQNIVLGAKYTFITIAHIPPRTVNKIFIVGDDIENRIFAKRYSVANSFSIIADNKFYDLGYTGRMVQGYTQWLNQKFVPRIILYGKRKC